MNNLKCMLCGGDLVEVILAPMDLPMPYAIVLGIGEKSRAGAEIYMCKRCGNLKASVVKEENANEANM